MKPTLLVVLVAVASACHSGITGPPDLAVADMAAAPVNKVDVLFMLDNSLSTSHLRDELKKRFPMFVKAIDDASAASHPASYHFGVVTSDLGAGTNTTACKPGGDGGRLQVGADPSALNIPANCQGFAPTGGARFLDYNQLDGTDNFGDLDLPSAFNCIASTSSSGCGFEHVLESVYKALHDPVPGNEGFLRQDALLVVLYLTDEDDCSAPADSDLFDPALTTYGTLHSFRCTQYGITCGDTAQPLPDSAAGQPLTNCRPLPTANGGKLFDVERYVDFFTKPAAMGGVKENPADVILAAIIPPPTPFGVQATMPCADQVNTASCPILQHSCVAATNSMFFGDPAVRVAAVVNAAANSQVTSLCDTDYSAAVAGLAQKIVARLK
jgi:hypothetical protein